MTRTNHRQYDSGSQHTVFTWDIDKTYLATETDRLADLLKTAFEFAIDKRELIGTVPLLKGLRRGTEKGEWIPPLYFVSASPSQMRGVLERKMLLDGVEPDGITLKGQVTLLMKWGLSALRRQVGYKLAALLLYRLERPGEMREVLFGDDSESDPSIYSLYRRIVDGQWDPDGLRHELKAQGEPAEVVTYLIELANQVEVGPFVEDIYIQITGKKTIPGDEEFPGVFFVQNALQSAILLEERGHVDPLCVQQVAETFSSPTDVHKTLRDGQERGLFTADVLGRWKEALCD